MARLRGIDPYARPALVEAITSVLDRTPDAVAAVRSQLVSHRDAAAQNLDFERASRVQAEMQGFEWVVSEQNVTLPERQDFDVCGWSHGIWCILAIAPAACGHGSSDRAHRPTLSHIWLLPPTSGSSSPSVMPCWPRSRRQRDSLRVAELAPCAGDR